MVTVKNNLTIIKVYWEGKTYQIKAESVDISDKQDIEKTYATDSHDANWVTFGKCEYTINIKGIQSHRTLFNWIRERQRSGYFKGYPAVSTYRYDGNKVVVDRAFSKCFVEEISGDNSEPYDVKLVALNRAYRNSQNQLI